MNYIKLNDINVQYKVDGEGIPLIFLHGLSDSSDFWLPMIEHFSSEYQVYAPDLRGHGSSSKDVNMDMELLTSDLRDFIIELNIQKFHLIGFSLGALIALNYSIEFPNKIRSLIICSGYAKATAEIISDFKDIEELTRTGGLGAFFDVMIKRVYTAKFLKKHHEYYSYKESVVEMNSENIILQSLKICEKFDVENRLSEIKAPSLILCGREDNLISQCNSMDLKRELQDSKLVQLKETGHNIFLPDKLPKIKSEVHDFLKKQNITI